MNKNDEGKNVKFHHAWKKWTTNPWANRSFEALRALKIYSQLICFANYTGQTNVSDSLADFFLHEIITSIKQIERWDLHYRGDVMECLFVHWN